jgi:cobalt-zinc-cadmium efflux system protein
MGAGHHHHEHGDHGHHHGHAHGPADPDSARWVIGVGLNLGFCIIEAAAGIFGHSTALLADAGHNLSDVLALALAGGAAWLARRPAKAQRTYGFGKSTVIAALINAIALIFACGVIATEALERFYSPEQPATGVMMVVAGAGIVVNGLIALLFMHGRANDTNVRAAFMHMVADAGVSAGVVVAALAIAFTGWTWIDPAISLVIVGAILGGTVGLLKEAFDLSVDAAPENVDVAEVRAYLVARPGVTSVHDLHVWPLSTTECALTAHLVRPEGGGDDFIKSICEDLQHDFGIGHSTIQVEAESLEDCEGLHA